MGSEPYRCGPFIGGNHQKGSGGEIAVVCPADLVQVATVSGASATDVEAAVKSADDAFRSEVWSGLEPIARGRILNGFADAVERRSRDLARMDALATGRPLRELEPQIGRLHEWLRYFAGIACGLEGASIPFKGGYVNYTQRVPLGVVGLVLPWNHPLLILVKKLAPALAAGNSVVAKPSELTPATAVELAEIAVEAGMPAGVFNVVPGGPEAGAALVADPRVAKIDVTGGTRTGTAIARAAADHVAQLTLELGGKTPVLVFADADLDRAVAGVAFGAFVAAGQTCVSGARILVEQSIAVEFGRRFAALARRIRLGHPLDPAAQMGPLVSARQLAHTIELVESALSQGASILAGDEKIDIPPELERGYFHRPVVLADVAPDMRVAREEVFGPVASIIVFDDERDAVRLANDSPYGLGASVWTTSVRRAHAVANRLDCGVIWVNDHHRNDPGSPWGGVKQSGYGRENGWEALRSYTSVRSVIVNTSDAPFDWFSESGEKRYG